MSDGRGIKAGFEAPHLAASSRSDVACAWGCWRRHSAGLVSLSQERVCSKTSLRTVSMSKCIMPWLCRYGTWLYSLLISGSSSSPTTSMPNSLQPPFDGLMDTQDHLLQRHRHLSPKKRSNILLFDFRGVFDEACSLAAESGLTCKDAGVRDRSWATL